MQFLADLLDILFPRRCHICGSSLSRPGDNGSARYICPACLARLPRTHYHRRPDNPMEERFAGIFPFTQATGHFFYSPGSELSELIQDFKYRHFRGLARFMGRLMAEELFATAFFADIDALMPIPMHFMKKARRGYNQTEEIALGISRHTDLPVLGNLTARRPHKTQTSLSRQERIKNLDNVFSVKNPQQLKGKHLLLIDDVCTTGTTIIAAAETLTAACPGLRISILTLGVTF